MLRDGNSPQADWRVHTASLSQGAPLDLADILGAAVTELTEKCQAAQSARERLKLVDVWLSALRSPVHEAHPAVAWMTQRLASTEGRESIATLRAHAGIGTARLFDTFRQQVGTIPKRYARVLRFRRALGLLQRGGAIARMRRTIRAPTWPLVPRALPLTADARGGSSLYALVTRGLALSASGSSGATRVVGWTEPVSTMRINAIRMTVIPLIVSSLLSRCRVQHPAPWASSGRAFVIFLILLSDHGGRHGG